MSDLEVARKRYEESRKAYEDAALKPNPTSVLDIVTLVVVLLVGFGLISIGIYLLRGLLPHA